MNQNICETLRSLRKNCGYTMPQVEKFLAQAGCPAGKSSVSRWETGYNGPTAEQFLALCRVYHVRDVVETFSEGKTISYQAGLNELGFKKLEDYRQLLIASGLYKPVDNVIPYPERTNTRHIAHYLQPASAGYGVFLDSEEYQEVEVGSDVRSRQPMVFQYMETVWSQPITMAIPFGYTNNAYWRTARLDCLC